MTLFLTKFVFVIPILLFDIYEDKVAILLPKTRTLSSEEMTFFDNVTNYLEACIPSISLSIVFVYCLLP
jgi:hypothetical protein